VYILHCGGEYAIANIRGGGEYGKQWHQSGTKTRHVFKNDIFFA
jgi:prolyl oligopeptidase